MESEGKYKSEVKGKEIFWANSFLCGVQVWWNVQLKKVYF